MQPRVVSPEGLPYPEVWWPQRMAHGAVSTRPAFSPRFGAQWITAVKLFVSNSVCYTVEENSYTGCVTLGKGLALRVSLCVT